MEVVTFSEVGDDFVSPVKLLMLLVIVVQYEVQCLGIRRAKGFWIFLIRWRWLLTCLDMFVICCNWVGNDCFRFNATNWGMLSCRFVDEIF